MGERPGVHLASIDLLFDGAARDEAIHNHVLLLPQTEGPAHRLFRNKRCKSAIELKKMMKTMMEMKKKKNR